MYRSTLEDIEGRNYKVIDVVFVFSNNYGGYSEEGLMNALDQQADAIGADGIIGITISSACTWTKAVASCEDEYGDTHWLYDDATLRTMDFGRVPDMFAYGTAIKFLD